MTREELLEECFGRSDFPPPLRSHQMIDERTNDVMSNVDVYRRQVRIRRPRLPGDVSEGATTLTVLALAQVCTAKEHRGKGYARSLVRAAHREVQGAGRPLQFAALFGDIDFYGQLGYRHPEGAEREDFLVCKLGDEDWPTGRVTTMVEW